MKTIVLICAFLIGAQALTAEQYNNLMKKIQEIGTQCVEKEKATPEDLAQLVAFEIPPSNYGAKCILACFYEHHKMMKPDRTFDKDAVIHAFHELKEMDADLFEKIMKIVDTCYEKRQTLDDRCETASLMAVCVKTEADAVGITKESFLATD